MSAQRSADAAASVTMTWCCWSWRGTASSVRPAQGSGSWRATPERSRAPMSFACSPPSELAAADGLGQPHLRVRSQRAQNRRESIGGGSWYGHLDSIRADRRGPVDDTPPHPIKELAYLPFLRVLGEHEVDLCPASRQLISSRRQCVVALARREHQLPRDYREQQGGERALQCQRPANGRGRALHQLEETVEPPA